MKSILIEFIKMSYASLRNQSIQIIVFRQSPRKSTFLNKNYLISNHLSSLEYLIHFQKKKKAYVTLKLQSITVISSIMKNVTRPISHQKQSISLLTIFSLRSCAPASASTTNRTSGSITSFQLLKNTTNVKND